MKDQLIRIIVFVGSICSTACSVSTTTLGTGTTQTTVFEDGFSGTDGSSPSSSDWSVSAASGASFNISANRLHPVQGSGASPAAIYKTLLDKIGYTATVDIVISGGSYAGDAFIVAKSASSTSVANSYVCGVDSSSGKVIVAKIVSGTSTQLAASQSSASPMADGTTASLSFDVVDTLGSTLTCTLTVGSTQYTATVADSTYIGAGYWGLFGGNAAGYLFFDNFKIVN